MKQNITLSLEKDLIKKGKSLASRKETSLSKLLSDLLRKIVSEEEQYESSKKKAFDLMDRGFRMGGKITCSRDDLHDR